MRWTTLCRITRITHLVGALAVGLPMLAAPVSAQPVSGSASPPADPQLQTVQAAFVQRFAGVDVTTVRRTPFAGLFEVQLGTNLVYTDAQAAWVLDGVLIDGASRQNLTEARQRDLAQAAQAVLPQSLALAVKQVKGVAGVGTADGNWIAIFEDPNCGYCKQLRRSLESVENLTVYSFLYPILSPDSRDKARDIWCATDQVAALDDWMLRGQTPARAQLRPDCDAPLAQILALGQQLMVRGTPAIFFADGSRADGALPLAELQARLAAN